MDYVFKKNFKGDRMNLFVSYTPEETSFLLEVAQKKIEIKHDIFSGADKEKMGYFKIQRFSRKDMIHNYDFVFVKSGKLGVVFNGKVVKTLKEGECFGYAKKFLGKDYVLLVMEESEVVMFDIGNDVVLAKNLLKYVSERIKNCTII
jgi:hypothetical protein